MTLEAEVVTIVTNVVTNIVQVAPVVAAAVKEAAINFWDVHSILFIIAMLFFPRLTIFFGSNYAAFAGPLFWCGFVLFPRITTAIIACNVYGDSNPVLCVIACFWAISGDIFGRIQIANNMDK